MMIAGFNFAAAPHLHFGAGKHKVLPDLVRSFGSNILLITGANSFQSSIRGQQLIDQLQASGSVANHIIDNEPTPSMIDDASKKNRGKNINVVIAVGGGSVLDAGKAISAMLTVDEPVKTFLEGVGTKSHPGSRIPFIALPTTAGTGSEATKNAVLSEVGEQGYKKSLRHNKFIPDVAIVDPELSLTCSPSVTASSGMDAFTQLLESYLSTAANPMTDALALEGLKQISTSLLNAYRDGSNLEARTGMSLAAYLSGVTLANAGLGLVHGFASSVGGFFDIPHGLICSSLMSATNEITVRKLRARGAEDKTLSKYAVVGKLFSGLSNKPNEYYVDHLLSHIQEMADEMQIPKLSKFVPSADHARIAAVTENKNNPIPLNYDEILEVLSLAS
jgi:alcohol dehydrogenase class IV